MIARTIDSPKKRTQRKEVRGIGHLDGRRAREGEAGVESLWSEATAMLEWHRADVGDLEMGFPRVGDVCGPVDRDSNRKSQFSRQNDSQHDAQQLLRLPQTPRRRDKW